VGGPGRNALEYFDEKAADNESDGLTLGRRSDGAAEVWEPEFDALEPEC
jgi:hypothetical protein